MNLADLTSPDDIKNLSLSELTDIAMQARKALIQKTAVCGGHLGPSLGAVELIMALHYVFNSPTDKIVYDVSHQSYMHKILTGRVRAFTEEAHYHDVTGYTDPQESEHDLFNIGHTSTSVSLASGLAKGRDITGGKENVIALIGDGSLSGGEAYEGLDYAATLGSNMIIIVNDNGMSIAETHGGIYEGLKELRETKGKSHRNLFTAMGFEYRFLVDGNDLALADPAWLRRQVGVVLQENVLLNRSVRDNIALADPGMPLERVMHAAKLAGAHDFIMELPEGYDTMVGEQGAGLSGGQRQRIAIARALVGNPRILILDEATSALDYESERAIMQQMQAICRNRTVLIIAHRLSTVRMAHRIIAMDKGQIVEQGSHQELLAKEDGYYRYLHQLQNG